MSTPRPDTAEAFLARRQARRIVRLENALRDAINLLEMYEAGRPKGDTLTSDLLRKVLG